MDEEDIKKQVWNILPQMTSALKDVLSVSPMYNARLTKTMGIHPVARNRGNGNFLLWTLLRDERTSGNALGVGALEESSSENTTPELYSNRNILVSESSHNPEVANHEDEIIRASWGKIQTSIQELCELLKTYIKLYPEKAYGGSFIRDMDINLCQYSASGEFVDYLIKVLMHQGVLDYTGMSGPRGSYLLEVIKDVPYEIQTQLDPSKFRKGVSRGEALASLTFMDFMPDLHIVHQSKWKKCRDKRELPFDFYDDTNGVLVEIDGAQHFRPVEYFGGEKSFEYVKRHDAMKNSFAAEEGLRMVRIDSSTRDVRECLRSVYEDLENLPAVSLYGDGYNVQYCEQRIPDGVVVNFDAGLKIFDY